MILPFAKLPAYQGLVSMVDGSFDPLHPGHLAYFRAARSLGYPLLCNLCPDAETEQKHPVLLPASDRAQILASLDLITYVHVAERPTHEIIRHLKPAHYVKGTDWLDKLPKEIGQVCDEVGTKIVYTTTKTHSSSDLLKSLQPDVDAFETLVQSQQPATTPWEPVTDYSFDARKAIEGQHPELIRDVLQPEQVLDVGCGSGTLLRLLDEVGVPGVGFDVSVTGTSASYVGPIEKRIMRCDVSVARGQHSTIADVVICREVLEHLTVRQIRWAVSNLCGWAKRLVYLTTRFAKNPRHLLSVDTQDGLDPTHITMLNQDFLRTLFVLEGFRRRADLEARMDWQSKGRVLVYERVA